MPRIAVIGAGAAGCFAAVELARRCPGAEVTVYEAASEPMAKLSVTGGGRCNITNDFDGVDRLGSVYPRGEHLMRRVLGLFSQRDCLEWFGRLGLGFVTQDDHRVFPESGDARQVVSALEKAMRRAGVKVECSSRVESIEEGFVLHFTDRDREADIVLVTSGGGAVKMLGGLGLRIESPVPSLFTFKIKDDSLNALMGTTVRNTVLHLAGTKFRSGGGLLITDWGLSGPAVLKLSSYAARHLHQAVYRSTLVVNWTGETEEETRSWMEEARKSDKNLQNLHPAALSGRLWSHLLMRSSLDAGFKWREIGRTGLNRLVATIVSDSYDICGRAAFKEEFVTCGGVSLKEILVPEMESKRLKGLFFAGEVLDIDAVTGGFNLQAAWSTAFCAAEGIRKRLYGDISDKQL